MKKEEFEKLVGKRVSLICNEGRKSGKIFEVCNKDLILTVVGVRRNKFNIKIPFESIKNMDVIR